MKKTYISPEINVYMINVVSHLMEPSLSGNVKGSIEINETPVSDDPEVFELGAREDNIFNNHSVWDNAW